MKIRRAPGLVASIVALAVLTVASPALAYVLVVTTSVPVTDTADEGQLQTALESAIEDVLGHAIGFTPTVVTLRNVRLVGNRLYVLLLIADAEGEQSIEALSAPAPSPEAPAESPGEPASRFSF
jgi:hypothetical protein